MKKRYLILAAIMITAITAVGCGKKKTEEPKQEAQATVTPAENTDTAGNDEGTLVDMQKSDDSDIKNVIGDKTTTASKLIIVNETGSDIAGIYVRPTTDDDDDWGDELIKGLFTLKDDDKALYYYDKNVKYASGKTVTSFDIRIVYADDSLTDCYFRKLPLTTITQITLKMDGSGDDAIPYATYLTASSKKETSTLNEVKKRLGLDDSSSDEEDDETPDPTATPVPNSTAAPTATPTPDNPAADPTATPVPDNPGSNDGPTADQAKSYIGQPLSSLIAALGEANGSDYENEPETGETGYHYYDTFTVSTTVDESGNEVVAGVW